MEEKRKLTVKQGWMNRFANALKRHKKLEFLFYGAIVLLVLALYFSTVLPKRDQSENEMAQGSATIGDVDVEQRLSEVLSAMKGAGHVEVMITYETGPELVPAMNVDSNQNRSATTEDGKEISAETQSESSKPAIISGSNGSSPLVLTEIQPSVRGVIVVAEGASDIAVRLSLQKAVQTVLNVPVNCIEVFEHEPISLQAE